MPGAQKAIVQRVEVPAPNLPIVEYNLVGTAPLVIHAWSQKVKEEMRRKQEEGDKAKNKQKREPKDFKANFEAAKHVSEEGWCGIPAAAFRAAAIKACSLCGIFMTKAKLTIFVLADGIDRVDFSPLVKITKGEPQYFETMVRLADGSPDICARPLWKPGWEAKIRVRYDANQFGIEDVTNLLMLAGQQVGIMEGRPDSKKSCGQGWGLFDLKGAPEELAQVKKIKGSK